MDTANLGQPPNNNPPPPINPNPIVSTPNPPSINSNSSPVKIILLLIVVLILGIMLGNYFNLNQMITSLIKPQPKTCTMEAKLCPDGTSVGRSGPNCEFSPCPTPDLSSGASAKEDPTANWETIIDEANGYQFKIPNGWESYPGQEGTDRFISRLNGWDVSINGQIKTIQTSIIIDKCYPPNCNVEIGKNPISGTKPDSKEAIKFASYTATKETYISNDSPWKSKKSYRLVIENDNGIYIITWQDFSPIFEQILSTFKFLE